MRYYAKESRNKDNTNIVIKKINQFIEDYSEDIKFLIISSSYRQTEEGLETTIDFRFQLASEDDYVGNHLLLYEFDMSHPEKFAKVQAVLSGINYDGRIIRETILSGAEVTEKDIIINGIPLYEGLTFEFNEEVIMVSHWEHGRLFFVFEDDEDPFLYPSFVKSVPLVEVDGLEIRAD